MTISHANDFKQLIAELQIDYTPAEFHGFLSGLLAGGIQDNSWQTLTYQFTNDGCAFSQTPLTKLTEFYQQLSQSFSETDPLFSLWIPTEENGFIFADAIAEWSAHFLLGLGLAQPKLQQETDDVGEAIDDLAEIAKLGYSEQDSNDELLAAGEEILEYLRVVSLFLHAHFSQSTSSQKPQIH